MRAPHCQKLSPLTFKQHAPGGEPIQRHPSEQEQGPKARFVLQQDDEVVSEVEVRLERARGVECAATQMQHFDLACTADLMAKVFQPPAQVDFLHVGKQGGIESPGVHPCIPGDEEARS